ncbi:MAG TPA: mechanosensitive ion channel domain-containing protein [Propionibacteriaceae bacterium]
MPSWFPHNLAETVVFVPLRVLFLIIVASIVRLIVHRLISRTVRKATGRHPRFKFRAAQAFVEATSLPADRREQRILALGSLARSAVTFVVFVVTLFMVLAEMGFNVTSIVAGTSVVAVTVAFGLQSIVKDLISGVFMLVEDQLGVGDYVDMEKASGTVEEIGLRVTQLRDDDGTVWFVRNGEVLRVGNFSQGGPGRPPKQETEVTAT